MSGYPQPVYYAPQPQVVMMQQPQVIVVQQAAAKPSGQWKGDWCALRLFADTRCVGYPL